MSIKSEPIIKNVSVDNQTIDTNGDGQIEISKNSIIETTKDLDYYLMSTKKYGIWKKINSTNLNYNRTTYNNLDKIYYLTMNSSTKQYIKEYNISTNSFNDLILMSTAIAAFGMCFNNNKVYIIGGYTYDSGSYELNLKTIIYDTLTNSISYGVNIPTGKNFVRIFYNDNKIYVIGGDSTDLTVQIYDILNDSWTTGTTAPTIQIGFSGEIYNNKIYLFGDSTNKTIIQIYDILNDSWTTGTNLVIDTYYTSSVLYKNFIYIFGGYDNKYAVQIYDILNDSCLQLDNSLSINYNYSTTIVNNVCYNFSTEIDTYTLIYTNIYQIN